MKLLAALILGLGFSVSAEASLSAHPSSMYLPTELGETTVRPVWIYNSSGQNFEVTVTDNCSRYFHIENQCIHAIPGQGSCKVRVHYEPLNQGIRDACHVVVRETTGTYGSIAIRVVGKGTRRHR